MKTATSIAKDGLDPNRFQAFKVSTCGNQIRRDYKTGMSLEDIGKLPLGRLKDDKGDFFWSYSLANDVHNQPH